MHARQAIYATDPAASRGRLHADDESRNRSVFQRDRDRVLHAAAFRRLKDKTQVFLYDEGDHYRTRLTHTLEVSQIARSLARALYLNEDLAEALALAHDLGHPPFGHAGERALDAEMADFGGFDHNAQSLRVVTTLEQRYPDFDGLNLTWETLEGLVKHNGPLTDADGKAIGPYRDRGLPDAVHSYQDVQDLELSTQPGPEAQVAAIADDIAYDAHDIDDGLRAGLLTLERLAEVDLIAGILSEIRRRYPGLATERVRAELVRRLISAMIADVTEESARRLANLAPSGVEDVRAAGQAMVGFSDPMAATDRHIKAVLWPSVYRHASVVAVMDRAERLTGRLFRHYLSDPRSLPPDWRPGDADGMRQKARRVADFIAGMTDRYALAEYRRLLEPEPDPRQPSMWPIDGHGEFV